MKKFFLIKAIFIMFLLVSCWVSSRALADTFNGSAWGSWADLSSVVNQMVIHSGQLSLDGSNKNAGFRSS
jgi:hypothetical protein